VTAACLAAAGHQVTGLDDDGAVVAGLGRGEPPIFEPGLAELVQRGVTLGRLQFTADAAVAVAGADVYWVTFDTPVDDIDVADVAFVNDRVRSVLPLLPPGCLVLISSQLPVGSTRALAHHAKSIGCDATLSFACSPENLRLGKAIEVFTKPDRVIVGVDCAADEAKVRALFAPMTDHLVFMSVESAEMTKHAINAFLAMSVAFANEIATVCERVGADAAEVARGLKSESRIGPRAYLAPGVAFAGGTLARDVMFLSQLGRDHGLNLTLIPSVKASNDRHRSWAAARLASLLGPLDGRTVALLGLTYKPGTDTLRRSSSIELARVLAGAGVTVRAFDPVVMRLPDDAPAGVHLAPSVKAAVTGADAVVIATEWPQFRDEDWPALVSRMAAPVVVDPTGLLSCRLSEIAGVTYAVVGRLSQAIAREAVQS